MWMKDYVQITKYIFKCLLTQFKSLSLNMITNQSSALDLSPQGAIATYVIDQRPSLHSETFEHGLLKFRPKNIHSVFIGHLECHN